MARVLPYYDFLQATGGLSREDFLGRIQDPFLYFPSLPELESGRCFQTLEHQVLLPDDDTTPIRDDDTPRGGNPRREDIGLQGIVPIRKDDGINVFSGMITLGRAKNNDLVVPDSRVSKFHLYFRRLGEKWTVTDANSTNGTTVDGLRLPPERSYRLKPGAVMELSGVIQAVFLDPPELFTLVQDFQDLVV